MKAIVNTDMDLRAILEQGYELKAREELYFAYSSERADPGNSNS